MSAVTLYWCLMVAPSYWLMVVWLLVQSLYGWMLFGCCNGYCFKYLVVGEGMLSCIWGGFLLRMVMLVWILADGCPRNFRSLFLDVWIFNWGTFVD